MIRFRGGSGDGVFLQQIGVPIGSMVIIFLISHFSLLISSCTSVTPEEQARTDAIVAAQSGYDRLLSGDYSGFLASRDGMESLPASFREQMIDTYKMYIAKEKQLHRGIERATATRAVMDSAQNIMQVFVLLSYGDGSQEEVVVPMVQRGDEWKMR